MSLTLSMEFAFRTTVDRLWKALTDSDQLARWVANIHTSEPMENDFKPVVGHRFRFRTTPTAFWNGIIEGEVLVVEEPHRLSYTWESGGEAHRHLDAQGSRQRFGEPASRTDGHLRRTGAERCEVRLGYVDRAA